MLWNASAIRGYAIEATDGQIGTVADMLFDDASWSLRWLVVETGSWLSARKVLIAVSALGQPDPALRQFPVKLTKQRVKDSPDVSTDASVTRQNEVHVFDYYGWDPYWGGGLYPVSNAMAVPFQSPELVTDGGPPMSDSHEDPHLRSISALTGYHILTSDGEIGHAHDYHIDDVDWTIRYIVVDTKNWWPGQEVLIAPGSVKMIDWANRLIHLNVTRDKVKNAPAYDANMTVDGVYDRQHLAYYGLGLFPM